MKLAGCKIIQGGPVKECRGVNYIKDEAKKASENESNGDQLSCSNLDFDEDILRESDCEKPEESADKPACLPCAASRKEENGVLGIPLRSLWPTLHFRRVAGVSPLLSIGWWYLSSVSPKRHCCRVSAADKGWRIYSLDPRPDAVSLYSGCTPGTRRAWFLPDDRHTASLFGLRGGWRHARTKLILAFKNPILLCPGKGLVLSKLNFDQIATHVRFLLISLQSDEMTKRSPFAIHKAIIGLGGEPKSVKRLRSGDLLIETNSAIPTQSFLLAKFFL
ncbi:uncharacterized protein TNCV_490781 [Trichonephila clavipes]|nr:uncharacterized protein TNCV_490781 [Trichonephila clavipes]